MAIDSIRPILVSLFLFILKVVEGCPFGSVSITNGLSYFRTREFHHGGFVYMNSQLGMNTFSERVVSQSEIKEALFAGIRFLKYIYPRIYKQSNECWSRNGFFMMNDVKNFPAPQKKNTKFNGHELNKLDVVLFPFNVENVGSENRLELILIKIYNKEVFQGALYYNCNIGDADFSFVSVAGNIELVGQESEHPYLSYEEQKVQKKLCNCILERLNNRDKSTSVRYGLPSGKWLKVGTNQVEEIEVMGLDI